MEPIWARQGPGGPHVYHTCPIVSRGCRSCLWITIRIQTAWRHNADAWCHNRSSLATAPSATQSPCRINLNGMIHQESATNCEFENYVTTSKFFVLNSLDKSHLNSVRAQYICDKLDWCYWIALPASAVVQSSNTVSCVSLSFRTHPCVLAIWSHGFCYLGYPHVADIAILILLKR